jgi:hypothetical protein
VIGERELDLPSKLVAAFGLFAGRTESLSEDQVEAVAAVARLVSTLSASNSETDHIHPSVAFTVLDERCRARTVRWEDGRVDMDAWLDGARRVGEDAMSVSLQGTGIGAELWEAGAQPMMLTVLTPKLQSDRAGLVAESLLSLLGNAEATSTWQTGFVALDAVADPYGEYVRGNSGWTRWDPTACVAGYYWAVLLTPTQTEVLGGADAVLREAPVSRALRNPAGQILCVLNDSPLDVTLTQMDRWREYLSPVLVPGYAGDAERVVEDPSKAPVWLREGPLLSWQVGQAVRYPELPVCDPPEIVCLDLSVEKIARIAIELMPGTPMVAVDLMRSTVRAWCLAGSAGFPTPVEPPVMQRFTVQEPPHTAANEIRLSVTFGGSGGVDAIERLACALDTAAPSSEPRVGQFVRRITVSS